MYFFKQRQQVVLLESKTAFATRRYDIVYAKELTVSKGIDNLIEIAFINQDQRYVNVDGKEITLRIIDSTGTELLLQKTLTGIYPVTGLMSLYLSASDLADIDPQKAFYTVEIPVGDYSYPAFVDAQGATRGTLNIVNSVLPRFSPSLNVTIPTHIQPVTSGNAVSYSSSTVNTKDKSISTIQTYYSNFTGSTQVRGSILPDFSISYAITGTVSYTNYTGTIGITIEGYHPYIQLSIVNTDTDGDVTEILYR